MNPFSALAELAVGFWKAGKAQAWTRLVFALMLSGLLSFLFVCGTALVALHTTPGCWPLSIGSGMVMAAIAMTVVFRRSPLTKGMMLVVPTEEAAKELATDLEVIQK